MGLRLLGAVELISADRSVSLGGARQRIVLAVLGLNVNRVVAVDQLIDAVAGQWLRRMEATIADVADSPDPADDKLERLIQAWARIHRDLLKEDRHLFDVYCTATETARPLVRKHRSRMRLLIDRVLDEGIATGKFDPRDREKAIAFISDAVYRFINPLTVRLDADVPQDVLDQRLAAMIRVVLRALANGSV